MTKALFIVVLGVVKATKLKAMQEHADEMESPIQSLFSLNESGQVTETVANVHQSTEDNELSDAEMIESQSSSSTFNRGFDESTFVANCYADELDPAGSTLSYAHALSNPYSAYACDISDCRDCFSGYNCACFYPGGSCYTGCPGYGCCPPVIGCG
jgi:hypothetical protein